MTRLVLALGLITAFAAAAIAQKLEWSYTIRPTPVCGDENSIVAKGSWVRIPPLRPNKNKNLAGNSDPGTKVPKASV